MPSEKMEGMWQKHAGAAITGLAAVLAAAVAGYWAGHATEASVRQQTAFEQSRLDEQARGAARVLLNELLISQNEMGDLVMGCAMKSLGREFTVEIPHDDLRLIASRLDPSQWSRVNAALTNLVELGRYIRERASPGHPLAGRPLSRHSVYVIGRDNESVRLAHDALGQLAGLPEVASIRIDPVAGFDRVRRAAMRRGLAIPR